MSREPKATRRECARMVEQAEKRVARIRDLRDAAEGSERVELNERLRHCERLLEGLRQAVAEVERDTFILSIERDIKRLH
jgi:exonuclease VII small subunit